MIVNAAVFTCSICGEASTEICAFCTKDACVNHRCERCKRCSDCCECEVPLSSAEPELEQAKVVTSPNGSGALAAEIESQAEPPEQDTPGGEFPTDAGAGVFAREPQSEGTHTNETGDENNPDEDGVQPFE
jgi:hypothetical protein